MPPKCPSSIYAIMQKLKKRKSDLSKLTWTDKIMFIQKSNMNNMQAYVQYGYIECIKILQH